MMFRPSNRVATRGPTIRRFRTVRHAPMQFTPPGAKRLVATLRDQQAEAAKLDAAIAANLEDIGYGG